MSKQIPVNKIRSDAAECQLVSSLATGEKGRMFAKIAQDLKSLAAELEQMTAADSAVCGEPPQLQVIRADAAECFALGNIPDSDEGEMFAKTGEYLNGLAFEIAELANSGGAISGLTVPPRSEGGRLRVADAEARNRDNELLERDGGPPSSDAAELFEAVSLKRLDKTDAVSTPAPFTLELSTKQDLPISSAAATVHQAAVPPRRFRSGLLLVAAALVIGGLAWSSNLTGIGSTSFAVQKFKIFRDRLSVASLFRGRQDDGRTPPRQHETIDVDEVKTPALETPPGENSDRAAGNALAALGLASGRAGEADTATPALAKVGSNNRRDEVSGLMEYLALPHRDLATQAAPSKTDDEIDQIRSREDAAAQELEQERQKVLALTNDLVSARRDLEENSEQSTKTGDELAQLRRTAETVTAKLEEERRKSDALQSDLAAARQALEVKQQVAAKETGPATAISGRMESTSSGTQQRQNDTTVDEKASVGMKTASLEPPTSVSLKPESDAETLRLIARAKSLVEQGDILAARIFLERAIEAGSAKASFAIAETYDPHILAAWNVFGTRGDVMKAREFYKRAALAGIEEANSRLKMLDR